MGLDVMLVVIILRASLGIGVSFCICFFIPSPVYIPTPQESAYTPQIREGERGRERFLPLDYNCLLLFCFVSSSGRLGVIVAGNEVHFDVIVLLLFISSSSFSF